MIYIVLITTPLGITPKSWWKWLKRKLLNRDYDTVCFSIEIDKEIIILQTTFLGYVKYIPLKDWRKSKYKSKLIPASAIKKHL